ncbi:MAG: hypothetical protein AB8F95_08175, partial [Bacteroidia bacterium]
LALLVSLFLFSSCKEEPVTPEAPTLAFVNQSQAFSVTGNLSSSSNPNALITSSYVNALQGVFVGYSGFFLVPDNAVTGLDNSWSWSNGLNTITYKWSEQNGQNCVKVSFAGVDVTDGVVYEVCENKDGSGGWMKIFDPENNGALTTELIWTNTGENSGTMDFKDYDNDGRQLVTWNADGSGNLKVYEGTQLTYDSTWNTDGSGSYKEYDAQGNLLDQGSWS